MGHRALVAYRRPDGTHDVRYSHWGADRLALLRAVTPETPLGAGAVDPRPLAEGVPLERVLRDYLDPCIYEVLYVVTADFGVTASRVCWLEFPDEPTGGRAALVDVGSPRRDLAVRTWFRATRTTLADVVDTGALSRRTARRYLESVIGTERDGRVYTYAGPPGHVDRPPGRSDRSPTASRSDDRSGGFDDRSGRSDESGDRSSAGDDRGEGTR